MLTRLFNLTTGNANTTLFEPSNLGIIPTHKINTQYEFGQATLDEFAPDLTLNKAQESDDEEVTLSQEQDINASSSELSNLLKHYKEELASGKNVNEMWVDKEKGLTLLAYSILEKHDELLDLCIRYKANLNIVAKECYSAEFMEIYEKNPTYLCVSLLTLAVYNNNKIALKKLIAAGATLNDMENGASNALLTAVHINSREIFNELILLGAKLDFITMDKLEISSEQKLMYRNAYSEEKLKCFKEKMSKDESIKCFETYQEVIKQSFQWEAQKQPQSAIDYDDLEKVEKYSKNTM